jgi:GT2 family glycosyltransferase/subtilisin-like proprotein convertase family protein
MARFPEHSRFVPAAVVALSLALGAALALTNDPLLDEQWHLKDRAAEIGGSNVRAAWPLTEGAGVVIGIVDDGLQGAHPDLSANYSAPLSWDFNGNDADPTPTGDDAHGTAAAGVAAARGGNAIGVSGVAPKATLAGLRLIAAPISDADEAAALGHQHDAIHISSNSWGPPDDGATLGKPGPLTAAAIQNAILNGRAGQGRIYVWAAGNGQGDSDNCNFDGYANSRYMVSVGAINDLAQQSAYSEPCSALIVSASSNGGTRGITTTDITGPAGYTPGDYTTTFGGTSSAAPLVSGAAALMLARNPALTWRDVQHILRRTSVRLQPNDAGWTPWAFPHNEKVGFGLLDATAASDLAATWVNVPAEDVLAPATRNPGLAIPDNNVNGVTDSLVIPALDANFSIEHIEVDFTATHLSRGHLHVTLTSPSGVMSTLATVRPGDNGNNFSAWRFGSARHWGESAAGTWTLRVSDRVSGFSGSFNSWTMRIYGYRVADPPAAFTKTTPSNGATNQSTDLQLAWTASTGATGYEYCLDVTNDGLCGNWQPAGTALSVAPGPLAPGTYYWHVRATSSGGLQRFSDAGSSVFHSFTTVLPPGTAVFDPAYQAPRCNAVAGECDSGSSLLLGRGTVSQGAEPNQPNTIADACADGSAGVFHFDESIDRLRVSTLDGSPFAPGKTVRIDATIWPFTDDATGDRVDFYRAPDATNPDWTFIATRTPSGPGAQTLSTSYVLPSGATQAVRAIIRYNSDPPVACYAGANSAFADHDDLIFAVGAAQGPELLTNGTFGSGLTGWQLYDGANVVHNAAAGGEFRYHQNPIVTGTGQAVIFQHTGQPVASGAPLTAVFDIGNLDVVRKRISVLMLDASFDDLSVCTFWLAPGAPMRTYRMATHTTQAWTSASIYFYTASPGTGDYRLDNVSMRSEPSGSPVMTECDDPTTPAAPGGAATANLLTNGDFGSALSGWSPFHDLVHQITGGVFEFVRPGTPNVPAGGILQSLAQSFPSGQIVTSTFDLGNSSSVRKRVTVILHDLNFTDLSACTFWLAPGQPLSPYTMRSFATQPWAQPTFSIYAATVGGDTWTRLDNVSLRKTPGNAIAGTDCQEPAEVPALARYDGRVPVSVLVLNYLVYEDLDQSLTTLQPFLGADDEVIVVDNASVPERLEWLVDRHPGIRAIPSERNLGFSGGVNLAARHATRPYLMLLNPDTKVLGPVVRDLEAWLTNHPETGVVGPRVLNPDGSVQASARGFPGVSAVFGGRSTWLSQRFPNNWLSRRHLLGRDSTTPIRVDWVAGSCFMTPRAAFDRVGGLDEGFFLYWEDADYCLRIGDIGLNVTYLPTVSVRHAVGRSAELVPELAIRAFHESALRLYLKHGGWRARLLAPLARTVMRARTAWRLRHTTTA